MNHIENYTSDLSGYFDFLIERDIDLGGVLNRLTFINLTRDRIKIAKGSERTVEVYSNTTLEPCSSSSKPK